MYEIIGWFTLNWDNILMAVAGLNLLASAITAITPTPRDDEMLRKVRSVLNIFALNVGHARNAASVTTSPTRPVS